MKPMINHKAQLYLKQQTQLVTAQVAECRFDPGLEDNVDRRQTATAPFGASEVRSLTQATGATHFLCNGRFTF